MDNSKGDMSETEEGGQTAGVQKPALRDHFIRRKVHEHELPGIMRKHIYTGVMGATWATIIGDPIFTFFIIAVGMKPYHIGIMQAVSLWLVAMQFLSAFSTQRTGRRKEMWFWSAMSDRILKFIGIIYAYFLWHTSWHWTAPVVLIYFICISSFFGNMAGPPWFSWLADIIPEDKHGAFWGRRSAWVAGVVLVALLVAPIFVDFAASDSKIHMTVIIFCVATFIGVLDLIIHRTIPEPVMEIPKQNHFLHHFFEPIRDRNYRPFLIFGICWNFAMVLGGSLLGFYFQEELGLKDQLFWIVLVFHIPTLILSTVTGNWTGNLVDRIGAKPVLFVGHIFWSSLPFFWIFSAPGWGLTWIFISSVVSGIATTAATTAANKMMIRIPPPGGRPMYIASYTSLASFAAGLGAFAAGFIHRYIGEGQFYFFGRETNVFIILFVVSFALRMLVTLIFVPWIKEIPSSNGSSL
jgi:MFS family permease